MRRCYALLLVLASPILGSGQEVHRTQAQETKEQLHFDVEYEFGMYPMQRPISVPTGVLQILRTEGGTVLSCAKAENLSADQIPGQWFVASKIHLSPRTGESGLFVQPRSDLDMRPSDRCLFGANVGPFWVFRKTSAGYQLVLDTSGHDLVILGSRTLGYSDIKVTSATATMVSATIYKFNGQSYKISNENTKPID